MSILDTLVDTVIHLDRHLNDWAGVMGPWLYLVLFAVIFCETGLVVTPFLPGDSLLFAVGALAAGESSPLNITLLLVLLWAAAVLGDAVNYAIGLRIGPKIFHGEDSRLFNRRHLLKTQEFYEKYGGKTIVLARFVPIVRTFAPFVAGIGKMTYPRFAVYNVSGGLAWVLLFLLGGYYFGNLPIVKSRFHWVILAIIIISVMPMVWEYLRARREAGAKDRKAGKAAVAPGERPASVTAEGTGLGPGSDSP